MIFTGRKFQNFRKFVLDREFSKTVIPGKEG